MTQRTLIYLPHTAAASWREPLMGCLHRLGYETGPTEDITATEYRQLLSGADPRLPASTRSLVCFEQQVPNAGSALIIGLDGRWDLRLGRCLSAMGGFAAAFESSRTRGIGGTALFYAGHTLEAWGEDTQVRHDGIRLGPVPNESAADARFNTYLNALCEQSLADLNATATTQIELIPLTPPAAFDPYDLDEACESFSVRMVLENVEEEDFARVFAELYTEGGDEWRWGAARTPGVGVPYIVLERPGSLSPALLSALTQRLDCYGMGAAFAGAGEAFTWVWSEPDGNQREGQGQGALDFISLWRDLAVTMGALPSELVGVAEREMS